MTINEDFENEIDTSIIALYCSIPDIFKDIIDKRYTMDFRAFLWKELDLDSLKMEALYYQQLKNANFKPKPQLTQSEVNILSNYLTVCKYVKNPKYYED